MNVLLRGDGRGFGECGCPAFFRFGVVPAKLDANLRKTGLNDAVITGTGAIGDQKVALGVMDFWFLGGSMGSVVGEKLTRLIEAGTAKGLPVVHHFHQWRSAHVRGHVQPHADGEDERGSRLSCRGADARAPAF